VKMDGYSLWLVPGGVAATRVDPASEPLPSLNAV
jgi:hypothetical protein